MPEPGFLAPGWTVPARVRAAMTTRTGGVSAVPYASFNLASHVGDDPAAVLENRRRLRDALELPAEPGWLEQVHGTGVVVLPAAAQAPADAAVTFARGEVCAVLVADCLPVFLAGRAGDRVGIAHAGWRGLAAGVVEATIAALACAPEELVAWLGPSIGPRAFEVGPEVRDCVRGAGRRRRGGVSSGPDRALAGRLAGTGAASPRGGGRHRGERRRSLHAHGRGALLFLPARRRDRAHGRARLARLR